MDSLLDYLAGRKEAIVGQWLEGTIHGFAGSTSRFLLQEQDRFRNPVGNTLREGLTSLFDGLMQGTSPGNCRRVLDAIIRVRAVHDRGAQEAVSFVFLIKDIMRLELRNQRRMDPDGSGFAALERQIDELARAASESYRNCREQTCQIRLNEIRRRTFVAEKIAIRRAKRKEGQ